MNIMVFLQHTIIMHSAGRYVSRHERIQQLLDGDASVHSLDEYIPIGNAVQKLQSWKQQGAEICYLSMHQVARDVYYDQLVLSRYGFPPGQIYYRTRGEHYGKVLDRVIPDVLIEDDCESIGGEQEITYYQMSPDLRDRVKSIIVAEFGSIDHLPPDPRFLVTWPSYSSPHYRSAPIVLGEQATTEIACSGEVMNHLSRFCAERNQGRSGSSDWDAFLSYTYADDTLAPMLAGELSHWLGDRLSDSTKIQELVNDYSRIGSVISQLKEIARRRYVHPVWNVQKLVEPLAKPVAPGALLLGMCLEEKLLAYGKEPLICSLPPELRRTNPHVLVLGHKGTGKTWLMAQMLLQDIESSDRAVIGIDSDGTLIDLVTKMIASHQKASQFQARMLPVETLRSGDASALKDLISRKSILLLKTRDSETPELNRFYGELMQAAFAVYEERPNKQRAVVVYLDELDETMSITTIRDVMQETGKIEIGLIGALSGLETISKKSEACTAEETQDVAIKMLSGFGSIAAFALDEKDARLIAQHYLPASPGGMEETVESLVHQQPHNYYFGRVPGAIHMQSCELSFAN